MRQAETSVLHGQTGADLVSEIETLGERLGRARDRIGRIIFGQEEVIEQSIITLL